MGKYQRALGTYIAALSCIAVVLAVVGLSAPNVVLLVVSGILLLAVLIAIPLGWITSAIVGAIGRSREPQG